MNCPFCGEYNDDGEILCTNCGIRLVKRSRDDGAAKIKQEWQDVDYEDGYSDVKKSISPDIKLPFIDFKKIIATAAFVVFIIACVYYGWFFWTEDDGFSVEESYELLQSLPTVNTVSEEITTDKEMLDEKIPDEQFLSAIEGVWVSTDKENAVSPEYHLFRDGTGYIYVKGMYSKMPITWEHIGNSDYASISMYYTNGQKVKTNIRLEDSVLVVTGTAYNRISESDVLEDDTPTYELDKDSLKWAGTYWTRRLDKMAAPIIILGPNGRGQINYTDSTIVTFSWVYEDDQTGSGGYIHMTYVSIDSPDYLMPADDKMLDFDAYGLFEKESD
ncbi:MAG: zinc ribbon domain-containing protein [Lachnospiraceae bacterium]|nr:zinc ribbon domain-containing protein [Lachnospiraceae bacterium]